MHMADPNSDRSVRGIGTFHSIHIFKKGYRHKTNVGALLWAWKGILEAKTNYVRREVDMKTKTNRTLVCLGILIPTLFFFSLSVVGAKEEIKIGVVTPMKFLVGDIHQKGVTMGAEDINAAGGVHVGGKNHKLKIFGADSNELLSVVDAVNAVERLITINKVDFLLGSVRSEAALAMLEVAAENRKIFMTLGAASPALPMKVAKDYDKYKYWFRGASANSIYQANYIFIYLEFVARAVKEQLGIDNPRVAVVAEKAVWADPIVKLIKAKAPKVGVEFVGAWRPSATAVDLSSELSAVRRAKAHIILFFAAGPVDVTISRQAGELQIPAIVVGTSVDATTQDHWKTTDGNCNYRMVGNTSGNVAITQKTRPFWKRYSQEYGEFPCQYTTAIYDTMFVLKEAIERSGNIESEAVIKELEKTDYQGVSGRYAFHPLGHKFPHDRIYGPDYIPMFGTQWQNGDLVVVWPDGRGVMTQKGWEKVHYEGTKKLILPPWMMDHWKKNK